MANSADVQINDLVHTETVVLDSRGRKRVSVGEQFANKKVRIVVDGQPDHPNQNNND